MSDGGGQSTSIGVETRGDRLPAESVTMDSTFPADKDGPEFSKRMSLVFHAPTLTVTDGSLERNVLK